MQAGITSVQVMDGGDLVFGTALRDAVVAEIGGRTFIYLVTGSRGGLTALELQGDGSLSVIDEVPLSGVFATGVEPRLLVAEIDGTPSLILSGQSGATARSIELLPGGGFGMPGPLAGDLAALVAPVIAEGPDGTYLVAAGGGGLQSYSLSGGVLTPAQTLPDDGGRFLAGISAARAVEIGGQTYIVAASESEHAVSVVAVGAGGAMSVVGDIGAADGVGLTAPSAIEVATLEGRHFALVESAGSGALSVIEITDGGVPVLRDYVVDDLATRFQGVEALAVHEAAGRVFVAAGGGDDGVTLFTLAPTGRLIALATVEDSLSTTLTNVSAIAMAETGGALQIVVAGTGETGLTRFEVPLAGLGLTLSAAPAGGALSGSAGDDLLAGQGGADSLAGGAGDDILIDGGASDTMTGSTGADLFVFAADGQLDIVTDFEPGVDRLDLSAFAMLYHPSQLTAAPESWGVRLTWRDETIELHRAGGGAIDISGWTAADILDLDRPQYLPIAQSLVGTAGDDTIRGGEGADTITGGAGDDRLDGEGGADAIDAGTGNDFVTGGFGDDLLLGGGGFDDICGGAGNDTLFGGNEADLLHGDDGDDEIHGEVGVDNIFGGAGSDTAFGGSENDWIWGGDGADMLHGGTQEDRLFGDDGDDELSGGAGFDRLEGGAGNDTLRGGNQADNLFGQADDDVMWGEGGFDRLFGGDGDDWGDGGEGPDSLFGDAGNDTLFGGGDNDRFFGGSGDDHLFGGESDDTLWAGSGFDLLDGGPGDDLLEGNFNADTFVFRTGDGGDTITDFEALNDFEKIDLAGVATITDYGDLVANHLVEVGADAVIDAGGGDRITLLGVSIGDLDAADFIF